MRESQEPRLGLAILSLAVNLSIASAQVQAVTRMVPDQFPTIQGALAASSTTGDTVLVRPGTYMEHIDFLGKDVVVWSLAGPESTVIDATNRGASVVRFVGVGEARLEGFTLRGGTGAPDGGGVIVRDTRDRGPIIENNWIIDNIGGYGGGIYVEDTVRVIGNRIANNTGAAGGGGIYNSSMQTLNPSPRVFVQNEIFGNRVGPAGTIAGGANLNGKHNPIVFSRNIVACNNAPRCGGLAVGTSTDGVVVEGNTIFANWGQEDLGGVLLSLEWQGTLAFLRNLVAFNLGGGIQCDRYWNAGELVTECNDVIGNNPDFMNADCTPEFSGHNNLRVDPLFGAAGCPYTHGDLCLSPDSPLLPGQTPPGCGLIGALGQCVPIGVGEVVGPPRPSFHAMPPEPNPFHERTAIAFHLPQRAQVEVSIYGVLGRRVRTMSVGSLGAGDHEVVWDSRQDDGQPAVSGAYLAVIRAGERAVSQTLLLIR